MNHYPVITLCGSTRYEKEFRQVEAELTLDGYLVFTCGVWGHSTHKNIFDKLSDKQLEEFKASLDDQHRSKIDLSDAIYVINPELYIGRSTGNEISYASMMQKGISFMNDTDFDIDAHVNDYLTKARAIAGMQKHRCGGKDFVENKSDLPADDFVYILSDNVYHICPWEGLDFEDVDKSFIYQPFDLFDRKAIAEYVIKAVNLYDKLEEEHKLLDFEFAEN